ncbi:MAG: hypothetical protein ACI30N_03635 [Muribaculaceae bacterium]
MKKLFFLIISLAIVLVCSSCEEKLGDKTEYMTWETMSASGDSKTTAKKGEIRVSCGPEGGSVCLKSSCNNDPGMVLYPKFDFDKASCNLDGQFIKRVNHELCDVRVEGNMLYIEFPPCSVEERQMLEFHVYSLPMGSSDLIVTRQP